MEQSLKEQLAKIRQQASARLNELLIEQEEIYSMFPDMRPKRSEVKSRPYCRTEPHWTQRPENRGKLMANIDKMNAAWRRKFGVQESVEQPVSSAA